MSYNTAHMRIRKIRGSATAQLCACGAQAQEWAYIGCDDEKIDARNGMRYSDDVNAYRAMCRLCHRRFDAARITHCPKGHEYAGWNLILCPRRKCRTCHNERVLLRQRTRVLTPEEREHRNEMQRQRRARKKAAA